MALPQEEWLAAAKRQPVGGSGRIHHLREKRPNLIVGNDADRYWSFCQACKQGGVVMKEHVRITARQAPVESHSLVLPNDMLKVIDSEPVVQQAVLGFLASKNMDAQYLPELWFSKSRCRVLLMHGCEWLGRDTTGASPQKWLTFNGSNHLEGSLHGDLAVVVEDPFSFYKVEWASRSVPGFKVYTSLGTRMSDELLVKLLQHKGVMFFYDDDAAGHKGAACESKRLRALGVNSQAKCASGGRDPKDMSILEIQQHIRS